MKYHAGTPVLEFHQKFGHPIRLLPAIPTVEEATLRLKLIFEEALELADALGYDVEADNRDGDCNISIKPNGNRVNMVEVADALGDIRYVTDGANLVFGIPGQSVLNEIHRSNMSKLGADGEPIYRKDGKILKGPNYSPPDIVAAITAAINETS